MEQLQVFQYNGQIVEFDFTPKNLMVNATEMGKIFGETVEHFTRVENTKKFISECLKNPNMGFLGIEKEEDLIISRQRSGTWMHRILALKFAAWLDPAFELWVYSTIDEVLFGNYRKMEESLKRQAAIKNRMDKLRVNLLQNEEYRELERLELEERQAKYSRGKENRQQLDLFRSQGLEITSDGIKENTHPDNP